MGRRIKPAKDTNGVTTSGKRPRGRPRKLPAANRRDSGVANDVDRGGGGDGDGELGGDSRRGEDADMLKEILLDNCDDKEEDDHVYTCVAATVSTRTLSRAIVDVHDLQHELYGVCDVNVTEATPDICILHGSWLDIAKAKRHIGQLIQQQKVRDVERSEGKGTCNSTTTEHEQTPGADTSPERVLKEQGTANCLVTGIKDEPGTCNSHNASIVAEQGACNSSATGIMEDQGTGISPGAHLKEQGPGSKRGSKRKISVSTAPSMKPCSVSVSRLLADNDVVTEEMTPSCEVAVKRSRRTRKPTFSSSEWETPLDSPCRQGRISDKEKESTKVQTKSSPSVRVSRPKKKQCDGPKDPVQKDECDTVTAGNAIISLKQRNKEARSDSTSVVAPADCDEVDSKQNAAPAISEDATCAGGIVGDMNLATQTGGSTETKQVDDGDEMMTPGDSPAKSQIEDNHPVTDADQPTASNGRINEVSSTVCEICGFKSATTQGLINHKGNYHSVVMFECDICFRQFGYKNVLHRHRGNHLRDDGTLKESAVIVHQMALKKLGRVENLSSEMLRGAGAATSGDATKGENGTEAVKMEESQVEDLLNWEKGVTENSSKNADSGAEKTCTGNEVEELREVGDSVDSAARKELKTEVSEEKNEVAAYSVGEDGQTENQPQLYECELCGARLTQAYYLKKHYDTVHYSGRARRKTDSVRNQLGRRNDTAYACPHCTFVCYRIQNFTRHVDSHRQPAMHKCAQCDYTNKLRGEVARHVRNAHGEKTFVCAQCACVFRTQILLNCHVKQRHEKARRTVCEICGKVLTTRKGYYKHKENYHGDGNVVGKIMCQVCGRVLNSQKLYDAHWKKCHGDDAVENDEERAIGRALHINADGIFECRLCAYKNDVAREVRRHIIRVHAEKKFKCDRCDAAFPRQSFLDKHVSMQHQGGATSHCGECSKTFKNYANMKAHMNRVHLEDKPHTCSVCLRSFYDKRTLVMHMDLHRPEEERDWKFECQPCGRHFRFKCNYEYHMQDHTGQRPHVCPTCNRAFKTKSMLETHATVHSAERPYSCARCGKTFKLRKYLDVHVLTHASEKVCCAACGKIFGQPSDLRKHICRAIPVAAPGIEGNGLELVANVNELQHINIEGFGVLGDGATVTAILVEQHPDDIDGSLDAANTHMVIEQHALVCETPDGGQLFPLADTGDGIGDGDGAVAMYMCGLCRKLCATQEEINEHMLEHLDDDDVGQGDEKLLAQLEPPGGDTGDVPSVTVENVPLDSPDAIAYM